MLSIVQLLFFSYAAHRKVEILRVIDGLDTGAEVDDVASAVVLGALVFAEINGRCLPRLIFAWLLAKKCDRFGSSCRFNTRSQLRCKSRLDIEAFFVQMLFFGFRCDNLA